MEHILVDLAVQGDVHIGRLIGRNMNGRTPYRAFTDELPKNDVKANTKKAV
jgi:hypothetical protein